MTTKQILNDCYEHVATICNGDKRVSVYRAATMQDLPEDLIENYADPDQLCPDKPYKGLRIEEASIGCMEWDAQVLLAVHGSIVDMYVCAILVRPCTNEAEKYYNGMKGKKAHERAGMMWDSRNFDSKLKPKKKRVRATLKQVRMLEAERNDLNRSLDIAIGQCSDKDDMIKKLEAERNTLLTSNKFMEEELNRLRAKLFVAEEGLREEKDEVFRLVNRGFWARVFNM